VWSWPQRLERKAKVGNETGKDIEKGRGARGKKGREIYSSY